MEKSTPKKEKITGSVLWAFSLIYSYGCLRLKLGTMNNPGPGFIPAVVGILLLLCTGTYLYKVFKGKRSEKETTATSPAREVNYWVVFGIVGSIIFYPFLLGYLKFIGATLITVFLMLVLLRFKNLTFSFLTAIGITLISFVVFARLLGVALPSGILEELIFRIGN
jgi:putative tricarboxylic transport membrane protein